MGYPVICIWEESSFEQRSTTLSHAHTPLTNPTGSTSTIGELDVKQMSRISPADINIISITITSGHQHHQQPSTSLDISNTSRHQHHVQIISTISTCNGSSARASAEARFKKVKVFHREASLRTPVTIRCTTTADVERVLLHPSLVSRAGI